MIKVRAHLAAAVADDGGALLRHLHLGGRAQHLLADLPQMADGVVSNKSLVGVKGPNDSGCVLHTPPLQNQPSEYKAQSAYHSCRTRQAVQPRVCHAVTRL